ncbi:shikimate dehydrogenase family protein [Faecalibacter bovis]|uniref:Shikimate dehydrogenase n=1 Tax=Faecalibacter bovis TaxID=2898187 RepID=A0ABX7XCT5_9FLAO|nr:shikimate dehydrogenase [Faecalibacter bovis]QTV05716.1 shikimate dehydrogenase [Faecalibacter bovis]
MKQFGLIGRNISYSFSKGYFADKFKNENIVGSAYDVFDLQQIQEVEKVFEIEGLKGFNVTIPYKQKIISYLDNLSPEAKEIGAVNTVLIQDGKKIGHNTDCFGFETSLQPLLKSNHTKALVLGYGGAAKAIIYVLNKLGIEFQIVSREKSYNRITYDDLNEAIIKTHHLIINCSPIGTFPNITSAPNIPYEFLTSDHLLYDLIYNPEVTQFIQNGLDKGATIKNGFEMLIQQAEKSWEIWNKVL